MNTTKPFAAALLLLALCGCFKVKEELAIHPDGSGSVRIETEEVSSAAQLRANSFVMGMGSGGGRAVFPPVSLAEARVFFPEPEFEVSAKEEAMTGGGKRSVITAAFKDVNALLSSRYAKAHQLSLKVDNGRLVFKARTGLENAIRYGTIEPDKQMRGLVPSGLDEARKKTNEMRAEFRVVLPGAAASPAGAAAGPGVTWVFEHSRCTNTEEYALRLGTLLEASCSAEGLKFSPATPARLGLLPFADLAEGGIGAAARAVDAPKVLAAARFVPHTLTVTRSISLSGDSGGGESRAILSGVVVAPKELAPPRWGRARLTEVVDAKGNSLLSENQRQRGGSWSSSESPMEMSDDEEAAEEGAKPKKPADASQPVRLEFRAPEWKVKEIARVRGVQPLHYPGPGQVIKLAGVVGEKTILDTSARGARPFNPEERGLGAIKNEPLRAAGMELRLVEAVAYFGVASIRLAVKGKTSVLLDAQVFDADGRPWPTECQRRDVGEDDAFTLLVPGRPKAPLSLAVLASSQDTTVEVPLVLDRVPVDSN